MGFTRYLRPAVVEYNYRQEQDQIEAFKKKEMTDQAEAEAKAKAVIDARIKLAKKIVMAVTDTTINDIVRPGPLPEERECYDMAQEIRDHGEILEELVLAILNTNKGCV